MSKRDVPVTGEARSTVGRFGRTLADIAPAERAGTVINESVAHSGVDPKAIDDLTRAKPASTPTNT